MESTFLQGLWITVMGMSLVFLALGILVAAMMALERLFRPRAKGAMATGAAEEPSMEEEEIVAIAVALASLLTKKEAQVGDRQLGSALEDGLELWLLLVKLPPLPVKDIPLRRGRLLLVEGRKHHRAHGLFDLLEFLLTKSLRAEGLSYFPVQRIFRFGKGR